MKDLFITLGGRVFSIEEGRFAALEAYLADLKRHFAGDDSADELLADIGRAEARNSPLRSARPRGGDGARCR